MFNEEMEQKGNEKSKVKFLLKGKNQCHPGNLPKFMETLTRNEVSTIFKARSRMIDIKANYKNTYQDLKCRLYRKEDETQEHFLSKCENPEENPPPPPEKNSPENTGIQ